MTGITSNSSAPPRSAVTSRHNWALPGLLMLAGVAAVILARDLLMPVFFSVLLALTFAPVRRAAKKVGIPNAITSFLIVLGLLSLLIAGVIGLSQPVRTYVQTAPDLVDQVQSKIYSLTQTVENVAEAGEQLENIAREEAAENDEVVVQQPSLVSKLVTTAPVLLAQIIFSLALLFFLIASGDMFYEKVVHSIPRFADKRRAVSILFDIEASLSRYFLTITAINAGLGVAIGIAMGLMGIPNPVLIGCLAFAFNFVPYLGALAGIGIVTFLGILHLPTIGAAAGAGFVYFLLTSLEGQFVTPWAVGKRLKLNAVVVFITIAFWGWAWSIIGMVVAMPLLIALQTMAQHIPSMRTFGDFLSARHMEEEKEQRKERQEVTLPAPASAG